jgi:hypothetical protein
MSGCNTQGCIAVKAFVESLMREKADVSWSVFEEQHDLNVHVRLWLPGKPETLTLENGQSQMLDEPTKQKITQWLKANL